MTRMSLFSSPFMLGFDEIEARIDRLAKAADGYPPYNIERVQDQDGSETYVISLAVAGFSEAELEITVEGHQLTIAGRQKDDASREFLHRGIAARQFQRSFVLADGMEVEGAELKDGMLTISVTRPQAETAARRIAIRTGLPGTEPAKS